MSNREEVFCLVSRTQEAFGGVDVMVSNAGIAQVKPLLEVTTEELERIFNVNVFGVLYGIQALAEQMKNRKTEKLSMPAALPAIKDSTFSACIRPPNLR